MTHYSTLVVFTVAAGFGWFASSGFHAAQAHKPHRLGYSSIKPIIDAKCVGCHNDKRSPEKVNLSSYAKLLASGERGSIVSAGHPEKSKFLLYVNGAKKPRMPFNQPPLSNKEIEAIQAWIAAGAQK